MTENLQPLARLMQRFVRRDGDPTDLIREIDAHLTEHFPGGEGFPDMGAWEDLEIAVACFRPGGGQFMYDETQAGAVFASVLSRLGIPLA